MLNNSDGFYIHIDDVDDVFVASWVDDIVVIDSVNICIGVESYINAYMTDGDGF